MDGTLFDSMPRHAWSWSETLKRHGMYFPPERCYVNEGRTGSDTVSIMIRETFHREATEQEKRDIYQEKAELFRRQGDAVPMAGVKEVLDYLHGQPDTQIWIVTGSGQQSLFDTLNLHFPGIFTRERMITAYDVAHGKPSPEPYLKAWEKSGLSKEDCCVVENAPLGVRSAKAAGLTCYAVNTGPLPDSMLWDEGADMVFHNMYEMKEGLCAQGTMG